MGFSWCFCGTGLPWCFHSASMGLMGFSWCFNGAPMGLPSFFHGASWGASVVTSMFFSMVVYGLPLLSWCFHETLMVFAWGFMPIPRKIMVLPWCFYVASMALPSHLHPASIVLPWCFHMVFPWDSHGASPGLPWFFHGTFKVVVPSDVHGARMVLAWCFHGAFVALAWCLPWYDTVLPSCFHGASVVFL